MSLTEDRQRAAGDIVHPCFDGHVGCEVVEGPGAVEADAAANNTQPERRNRRLIFYESLWDEILGYTATQSNRRFPIAERVPRKSNSR